MFYIVASTELNYLKLLMIIGNVKQTVTHMEFENKKFLGKKDYSSTIWEKSMTVYFAKCFFFFLLVIFHC